MNIPTPLISNMNHFIEDKIERQYCRGFEFFHGKELNIRSLTNTSNYCIERSVKQFVYQDEKYVVAEKIKQNDILYQKDLNLNLATPDYLLVEDHTKLKLIEVKTNLVKWQKEKSDLHNLPLQYLSLTIKFLIYFICLLIVNLIPYKRYRLNIKINRQKDRYGKIKMKLQEGNIKSNINSLIQLHQESIDQGLKDLIRKDLLKFKNYI